MVSKSYVPNHSLHKHYYGQGMTRFKGSRMQYGKGLVSIFKRVALPLLSKGAKIAAPHVLKAAKGIVRELVGQLLDGSVQPSGTEHTYISEGRGFESQLGH